MKRHDDAPGWRKRSGRLAMTFGDLGDHRVAFDGSMTKRHDSQRSGRLAVTVGDLRVVDRVVASIASLPRLGFDGSMMKRHDHSQRSGRLAMTQPVYPTPPVPPAFRTEKQLTAPADRPVRESAHAVAFSTGVAAGYDRNGPGSLPPNSPSQNRPPTSPVNHIRCSADHRPAWRWDAAPDVRRAVGVRMMGRAPGSHLTSAICWGTGTPCPSTLCPKKEVKMILKEPHARAA